MFERHGRVHTDGNDADDGTDTQQRVNPLQKWSKVISGRGNMEILNLCYYKPHYWKIGSLDYNISPA